MFVLQYYELAYLYYTGYYALASTLLLVTVCSAVVSTAKLHKIRQELFQSVDKQGLTPLVHNGRVRSDQPPASRLHACHSCWCHRMYDGVYGSAPAMFVGVTACMAVFKAAHLPGCCIYGCVQDR